MSAAVLIVILGALASGCLSAATATGRPGPVRRVAVLGDSLTFGLFGATPQVIGPLTSRLEKSGIEVSFDGYPGETVIHPWPGRPPWTEILRTRIDSFDPDVVIIQSVLFPYSEEPGAHELYLSQMTALFDIAQSRGAHVYIVSHQTPTDATEAAAKQVAQELQARAAQGRGIGVIPLDWWIAHCRKPFVADGWHFSANGVACWADAANAAVNQLRNEIG